MWRLFIPRNLSKKKLLFAIVIGFHLYVNEVLIYYIQSHRWPSPPSTGAKENETRVLLVADPQLIGHFYEDAVTYFGFFTRWDADRFLSKTFSDAYSHVKPNVVIFLGDILDEGSLATNARLKEYVDRFYSVFKKAKDSKMIVIPGDNDVGGEGYDVKSHEKLMRFEKYFEEVAGVVSEKSLDFIKLNYGYSDRYSDDDKLMELRGLAGDVNKNHFRIVLNHQSVLLRSPVQVKPILKRIVPNLFITAHEHLPYVLECRDCYEKGDHRGGFTKLEDVITVDMKDLKRLREIMVPTCNYRMGTVDIGYGVAVINYKSGLLKYTILWLPKRNLVMYSYLVLIIGIVLYLTAHYYYRNVTTQQYMYQERNHKKFKSTMFNV